MSCARHSLLPLSHEVLIKISVLIHAWQTFVYFGSCDKVLNLFPLNKGPRIPVIAEICSNQFESVHFPLLLYNHVPSDLRKTLRQNFKHNNENQGPLSSTSLIRKWFPYPFLSTVCNACPLPSKNHSNSRCPLLGKTFTYD